MLDVHAKANAAASTPHGLTRTIADIF